VTEHGSTHPSVINTTYNRPHSIVFGLPERVAVFVQGLNTLSLDNCSLKGIAWDVYIKHCVQCAARKLEFLLTHFYSLQYPGTSCISYHKRRLLEMTVWQDFSSPSLFLSSLLPFVIQFFPICSPPVALLPLSSLTCIFPSLFFVPLPNP